MIRSAVPADAGKITEMLMRSGEDSGNNSMILHFTSLMNKLDQYLYLTHRHHHVYLYEDNGIVKAMIGWTSGHASEGRIELKGVYVRPEYRGNGIGSQLMELFLKNMAMQNIGNTSVWIPDADVHSIEFVEHFGFRHSLQSKPVAGSAEGTDSVLVEMRRAVG